VNKTDVEKRAYVDASDKTYDQANGLWHTVRGQTRYDQPMVERVMTSIHHQICEEIKRNFT
jgi:hypothetical protein